MVRNAIRRIPIATLGYFFIWYEWYPQAWNVAFYTAPYDTDWCEVDKELYNGSYVGLWYCKDETSGQTEDSWTNINSTLLNNTAEWIVERPAPVLGGPIAPLVDYGSETIINAWAQTTTGVWYEYSQLGGPWALYNITMEDSGNVTDSTASEITDLNIGFTWKNYQ